VKLFGLWIAVVFAVVAAGAANAAPREPEFGLPIPVPYAKAAQVIHLAKLGDVKAQAQLGWMYSTGRGVPQSYYQAAKWYHLAAAQGHGWAQYELGVLYNKGEGVPRDYVLAHMWLDLSASQATGNDRDYKVRMRDAVRQKMTEGQVALAQQLARDWYKGR